MSDPALLRRVWSNRQLRARLAADETNSGGSGSPGSPIVRKFPFAFDTPNLLTGAAVYTPTIGDILLDAWIEIGIAWNGTSPSGDVAVPNDGHKGLFAGFGGGPLPMNLSDFVSNQFPNHLLVGAAWSGPLSGLQATAQGTSQGDGIYTVAGAAVDLSATAVADGNRYLPGKFATADPINVCVSTTGTAIGADPGSTQGAAILYLVTATPV